MRTNLVYIFADQWRYHALGASGHDPVQTPCMDHFVQEGLNLTNAYSTFPLCTPHRGSLMTGKYPLSIGLWTNCKIGLEEVIMLKPQEICIGNVLKDHGYHTGYIGKWHLDASEQNFEKHPRSGAKDWDAYTPPGERRQGFDYWLSYGACDEHLDPHYWADSPEPIRPGKWSAEYETDQAISFIKTNKGKENPFALFLSYNPPHLPYELVPDRYYEKFRELEISWRDNVPPEKRTPEMETIARQYFAAVYGIDEQFGRVMEVLKEEHLEEDTLVVLSADHGEMLGSHGLMSKNVWYEESVHIPLVMRQKGRIEPGMCPVLFASPDHMPTLLQLLDLPVPDTCEGYGHAASILKGNDPEAPEQMFICSYPGGAEMVGAFAKRGLTHKAYGWRGILTPRYTYVASNGYAPDDAQVELLYDRNTDPFQMKPRVIEKDDSSDEITVMRSQLEGYLKKLKDPFLCRWKELGGK
ncbi:MAG: sulfatase [Lachnospiraceae bacterium]|nr:sulfatase [Lachnospiraceae bacterium]